MKINTKINFFRTKEEAERAKTPGAEVGCYNGTLEEKKKYMIAALNEGEFDKEKPYCVIEGGQEDE